ncbi:hypothetical protein [Nocardia sp. NPDC057440]|uniref:hypothetical protein n=1 Tax=Nocardia sp. NPDC057440 TaxID=3346134 RepID=UPI003670CD9A
MAETVRVEEVLEGRRHAITRICDVTRTVLTREVWQARLPQIAYRPPCDQR